MVDVYSLQDSPIIDKSLIAAVNRPIILPPLFRVEGLAERPLTGETGPDASIMVPSKNMQIAEATYPVQGKRSKAADTRALTRGRTTDDEGDRSQEPIRGSLPTGGEEVDASATMLVDDGDLPRRQASPMEVEEAIEPTPKKRSRMKTITVPRTFMDNGYLMTEYVTELVPDDESETGEIPSAADSSVKGPPPPSQAKAASTVPGGKKQGSLLSFFKQK